MEETYHHFIKEFILPKYNILVIDIDPGLTGLRVHPYIISACFCPFLGPPTQLHQRKYYCISAKIDTFLTHPSKFTAIIYGRKDIT